MGISKMIEALDIIYECDSLSITEDDKKLCIFILGCIINELCLTTTEITAQYAVVKVSTWNNSYFCMATKKLCNQLYSVLKMFQNI